jgi:hypothetical protein
VFRVLLPGISVHFWYGTQYWVPLTRTSCCNNENCNPLKILVYAFKRSEIQGFWASVSPWRENHRVLPFFCSNKPAEQLRIDKRKRKKRKEKKAKTNKTSDDIVVSSCKYVPPGKVRDEIRFRFWFLLFMFPAALMNKWTNEQMNKWTNEQMNKWTNEQMELGNVSFFPHMSKCSCFALFILCGQSASCD